MEQKVFNCVVPLDKGCWDQDDSFDDKIHADVMETLESEKNPISEWFRDKHNSLWYQIETWFEDNIPDEILRHSPDFSVCQMMHEDWGFDYDHQQGTRYMQFDLKLSRFGIKWAEQLFPCDLRLSGDKCSVWSVKYNRKVADVITDTKFRKHSKDKIRISRDSNGDYTMD